MSHADDTTFYAVILRPLSSPQGMESLNQDLQAFNSWCLKWHKRLNPKKTEYIVVSDLDEIHRDHYNFRL